MTRRMPKAIACRCMLLPRQNLQALIHTAANGSRVFGAVSCTYATLRAASAVRTGPARAPMGGALACVRISTRHSAKWLVS